jgi:tetratricopeptide (TPR) repeat protein
MLNFLHSKKTLLVCFFVLTGSAVFAQSKLQNAWEAFFNNKTDSAKFLFNQAVQQNNNAADALLGLSLVAQTEQAPNEAFGYFQKFYAQSSNAAPYAYALWDTPSIINGFGKRTPEQLALLKQIAENTSYDGMMAAMAASMIGKHYEAANQHDKAVEQFAKLKSIDNWQITGEFENISTSGFDRVYPVIDHPEADATFTTKYGAKAGWHNVTDVRTDKWFDFTYYSVANNSVIFAQSFIKADNDMEAQLRIGVSGSVKVWVNDEQVLSVPEERNNDLDSYIQSIKLNKGYNRVLIQAGESYAGNLNFLLRITDNKGISIPNLTSQAQVAPYTKETTYISQKIEPFAITYFEDQIKSNPQDYLPQILLAEAYLRNDKTYEARRIIEDLRLKYPNSTFLNLMLIDVFNREDNRTGLETTKETIKNTDQQSVEGLMLKYGELYSQKDYDKAADIIKQLEAKNIEQQEFIYEAKIGLAGANKNQDELVRLGEEAYVKFPDDKNFAELKYAIEKELHKNPKAINVLEKYVADNNNYSVIKELSDAYFAAGNAAGAIKLLQEQLKKEPYAVGIYSNLGNQYYNLQQYDKSEEAYLKCISIAPTISSYYASLGKINEMIKNKDKAISYYQKALELQPNDYETIASLRKLQDKKDVFSYFKDPDVDAEIRNAPKAADYPDDNVVILDEEKQKVVYDQGGSEERNFITAKILTQKGIDDWKEYRIDYDGWQELQVEEAQVIKANGTKVPAERNENDVVFTNLEIGDVINIRYKTKNYSQGKLAGYFWDSFYFTSGNPHVVVKYSLLISAQQKFNSTFTQTPIEPVKSSVDGFNLYVWEKDKQEGLQYEDKMPPLDDIANVLYLTSIPDWKFVSDWYNDLASAKARTNYEVKSAISDLFKGKPNLTDMQKVEKIYNYITGNISYSEVSFRQSGLIPQNPSAVINTRIGDCKDVSTLFVAMCKEAGIPAQLVLVKTRDNGLAGMPLPSINFNHCIAKVNLGGKEYYIELTSQYLPFKCLYNSEINSTTLDIGDPAASVSTKYLNPATRKANDIVRNTLVSFKVKDMVVDEKTYKTAAIAGSMRESVGDLSQKDRLKGMKTALASTYPDVDITTLKYRNIDRKNPVDTVYMDLDYQINNMVKTIGGLSIFTIPWSDKVSANDLQINLPRYSGIDLNQLFYLDNETEVVTLNLGPGKSLVDAFTPIILKNDIIEYSITPKHIGNKLVITRTFKLKKDFVPADKVPEFHTFFKQMIDADNKELAVK